MAAAAVVALFAGAGAARAEEPGALRLELNRLEPVGEACRAYLLVENPSPEAYRSLRLDLFAFDADGVIARRVALEAGPLAPKKTSVKLFDFAGVSCERLGRVLLNDVIACERAEGPKESSKADCLALVQTGSRVARIGFVK